MRADAQRNIAAILDAATECLARDPETSIAGIAAAAGVGRITLYGHFKTRADLVDAVLVRTVQQCDAILAMDLGDRLETLRFLIHDRDPLFTTAFDEVFKSEGLRIITTLPQTPRMNAICERVIGTLRRELLDRFLILGERHLVLVLREYLIHYNGHRPHQSRFQRPPGIGAQPVRDVADLRSVRRKPVVAGVINEYHHAV